MLLALPKADHDMNCFCGMVDRRKAFSLISSRDHCQRSSPSRISNTPWVGFEPAQNMSSGLAKWSCAVVITTTTEVFVLGLLMVILPWIKLSWYSCFMWNKLGSLNRFEKFLPWGLSSFNSKESVTIMHGLSSDISFENSVVILSRVFQLSLHWVSSFFFFFKDRSLLCA